jgi:hypothetical protein
MNWDNLNWDNFSCVDMMRSIRNEFDAKFANMTKTERQEYLHEINLKHGESL